MAVEGVWVNDGDPAPPLVNMERLLELRWPIPGRRATGVASSLPWNWDKKFQASDDASEVALPWRLCITGFHSVGSRSDLAS